jgi:hypothetical protein
LPDFALSGRVGAAGTARITVAGFIPSGLVWVVSQISIEAQSSKPTMSAVVRKNGRFVTSSASGLSSSAGGAPYLALKPPDQLTVDYAGLNSGDTVLLSLFFREITWGQLDTMPIEVV